MFHVMRFRIQPFSLLREYAKILGLTRSRPVMHVLNPSSEKGTVLYFHSLPGGAEQLSALDVHFGGMRVISPDFYSTKFLSPNEIIDNIKTELNGVSNIHIVTNGMGASIGIHIAALISDSIKVESLQMVNPAFILDRYRTGRPLPPVDIFQSKIQSIIYPLIDNMVRIVDDPSYLNKMHKNDRESMIKLLQTIATKPTNDVNWVFPFERYFSSEEIDLKRTFSSRFRNANILRASVIGHFTFIPETFRNLFVRNFPFTRVGLYTRYFAQSVLKSDEKNSFINAKLLVDAVNRGLLMRSKVGCAEMRSSDELENKRKEQKSGKTNPIIHQTIPNAAMDLAITTTLESLKKQNEAKLVPGDRRASDSILPPLSPLKISVKVSGETIKMTLKDSKNGTEKALPSYNLNWTFDSKWDRLNAALGVRGRAYFNFYMILLFSFDFTHLKLEKNFQTLLKNNPLLFSRAIGSLGATVPCGFLKHLTCNGILHDLVVSNPEFKAILNLIEAKKIDKVTGEVLPSNEYRLRTPPEAFDSSKVINYLEKKIENAVKHDLNEVELTKEFYVESETLAKEFHSDGLLTNIHYENSGGRLCIPLRPIIPVNEVFIVKDNPTDIPTGLLVCDKVLRDKLNVVVRDDDGEVDCTYKSCEDILIEGFQRAYQKNLNSFQSLS